jgi:DNA-binding PucR family transcriptional regulator
VPEDAARDNADVTAIARIAANPDDVETLDVYCVTGSVRRAAELLHLHHSSVARRLERISRSLGIELTETTGVTRASLALATWRLLND